MRSKIGINKWDFLNYNIMCFCFMRNRKEIFSNLFQNFKLIFYCLLLVVSVYYIINFLIR